MISLADCSGIARSCATWHGSDSGRSRCHNRGTPSPKYLEELAASLAFRKECGKRLWCCATPSRLYLTDIATARSNEKIMVIRERRLLTGSWGLAVACIILGAVAPATAAAPKAKFALSSSDPQLIVSVPLIYTAKAFGCSGGNLSPELHWSGAPAGTQSFALTLFDRDERSTPSGWWHWVVYDLPRTTTNLPKGAGAEHGSALPAGTLQGRTDLGEDAYHGPVLPRAIRHTAMCSRSTL